MRARSCELSHKKVLCIVSPTQHPRKVNVSVATFIKFSLNASDAMREGPK